MATIQGVVSLRNNQQNSTASLVLAANTIHDMVVQSGMIQVADDEFTGQAKTFSETAGAELTQVVRVTTLGSNLMGYKVYKHPNLDLYVKINYLDLLVSKPDKGFFAMSYQLSPVLSGGAFDASKQSPVYVPNYTNFGNNGSHLDNNLEIGSKPITISCGVDHFWISRKDGLRTNATKNYASFPNDRVDPLSFAVVSSTSDNNALCIILPQLPGAYYYSDGYDGATLAGGAAPVIEGIRYYSGLSGSWAYQGKCVAGYLINPQVSTTANGIRVAQAELIILGERYSFNFCFLNGGALAAFSAAKINLTGITQKYQALPSFGTASHAASAATLSDISVMALPVVT